MVPEGSHVRSVYMDPTNGLCATDLSGKLLVDCSTIDTATCLTVKAHIAAHLPLAHFYDAPVSGGAVGAANGVLAFFLGCSKDDPNLPRLETLLSLMGKKIIPCGGPSLGLATKLAHNYLGAIIFIATSEAMNMGMRSGLDARILSNAFAAGAGQSTIAEKFNPVPGVCPDAPASNGYKPGFKIELHKKDLGLAVEMARRVGADLALGETALETYTRACNDPRCKDLDSSAIYRFLGGVEDWPGR
jgi:3-hydroxyisobutyrate dehydrogenase